MPTHRPANFSIYLDLNTDCDSGQYSNATKAWV